MGAGCQDILVNAGQEPMPDRCGLSVRQEPGRANGAQAAVCVFNRTRESFLCLGAFTAGALQICPADSTGFTVQSSLVSEDGLWLRPSDVRFTAGTFCPMDLFHVDLVYLDEGNRVVKLIEHFDPTRIVPARWPHTSVLKVRTHTIYSSRTQTGDELLICSPEELGNVW